jgi:RHS repeat-associated protein
VTGRLKSYIAAVLAAVVVATLAPQPPAVARPAPVTPGAPARAWEEIEPVPVQAVPARRVETPQLARAADKPEPVWPSGGAAVVAPGLARAVEAGGLPVRAEPVPGSGAAGRLRVQVLDRAATTRAGVRGVLLRAAPEGVAGRASAAGPVRLSVDYGAFATGFGADWASRLRLVVVPECRLSSPQRRECAGVSLATDNDLAAQTLTASVDIGDGGVMLGVMAAESGPTGDFSATKLQPSSTWSAGGSSGGFTWSYPVRVPPGVGGPTPQVGLSYSSQSVDGRHAATNNQPSWVGEGFEAWPGGYIERRYLSCADDMDGGANNSTETGDLCWVTDNATLSLNGVSGELLYNSSEGRWHLRSEDGSRIERKTGASNGDDNGEYWVVTTTDGTQYWFGRNRLPGWSSGDPVTESTWTVPVFGNHSGEPCHASGFAGSDCQQAWRWNLDYVVDVHGNSMSYWYGRQINEYARNNDPSDTPSYERGGVLERIDYGTRRDGGVDSVFAGGAPARVVFTTGDRCLSSCSTHNETRWPDTPWDQECSGGSCDVYSPTFWNTKRLASITAKVWNGSSYRNVERWTFTHSFPDPGDTTRAGLWLDSIAHEGLAGGSTVTLPEVEFTPVSLDNRVDEIDHSPAMAWHRIARIDTESGGAVAVTYSDRDCESSKPTLHTNTRRCYPVYWTPQGETDPVLDWFHKYVVTEVREVDMVGGQPEVIHRYNYMGGGAWHYTDDDGLVDEETKTWSVWRGYGRVGVTVGEGDTEQRYTETRYFRGMHGDKLPSGTRSVDVTDSQGGTWPDRDWFAGMAREQVTFNGPGGAEVSGTISDPWASSPTASRSINGTTVHARFTNTATTWSRTALDGGRPDRITKVTTSFDSRGMPLQVEDFGEVGVSGDERCSLATYGPRNTSAWLMDLVHRDRSFAVDCTAAANPAGLGEDDVISDTRTWYDGNGYGVAATRGLPTLVEELQGWAAGTPTYVTTGTATYDAHGRTLETRDALDRPTSMTYTPPAGGPVTGTTETNALGHTTTTTLDPAYGLATRVVDPNGKQADVSYDALGRLTAAWLPGRDKGSQTANLTFAYQVRDNNVTYVSASRLTPLGTGYITSHTLYDGLLRTVQTQAPSPSVDGGRILTNTFYDNAGRPYLTYGGYYTTDPPSTSLHIPVEPRDIPTQTRILFDGAGRATDKIFQPYTMEQWRTSTEFGGDRTAVTPPDGGTATMAITDARGQAVELRQYQAPSPTGAYDATTYDYDRKSQLVGVTDAAGNQWQYVYDLRGRKIEAHDPDSGLTRTSYDAAGQVTQTIDGNNEVLVYKYDQLGRRTHMYWYMPFGTPLARWIYDGTELGQLDRTIRADSGELYHTVVQGYTDRYQPTGIDVIIPSAETGLGGTYTTQYTYHEDGSPDAVAWSATGDLPGEGLHYEYDDTTGLLRNLRATLGTTPIDYVTNTDYNALGQVEQLTLRTTDTGDAVRLGYQHELETGRLTDSWVDLDTAPYIAADLAYGYDPAGNITSITDQTPDPDDTQCFTYDHLRQLTQAWTPTSGDCTTTPDAATLGGPAPYWRSWTYNQVGNRLTETDHQAGGEVTTSYTYPPAGGSQPHTLTSATTGGVTDNWTYDTGGNTLTRPDGTGGQQTLTWDREGHLKTLTDTTGETRYIYDADGNRLITRDPDGKTLYLPGQELRYDTATGTVTATRFYNYGGQTIASRTTDGLTWLAGDHQGTAQIAIEDVGQQVELRRQLPFGAPRGSQPTAWPNQRGFLGGPNDPTGLTHLGAREYDPDIGRFISIDPVMDLTDPQQMHGYAYANNNPTTYSDPTGLILTRDVEGAQTHNEHNGQSNDTGRGWMGPVKQEEYTIVEETDAYTIAEDRRGGLWLNGIRVPDGGPNGQQLADTMATYCGGKGRDCEADWNCHPEDTVCWENASFNIKQGMVSALWDDYIGWATDLYLSYIIKEGVALYGLAPGGGDRSFSGSRGSPGSRGFVAGFKRSPPPRYRIPPGGKVCNNSFVPGTLVLMADGTTKPIEEVEVGDMVLATNPETGQTEPQPVTDTITGTGNKQLIQITISDSVAGRQEPVIAASMLWAVTITATDNHPFWNPDQGTWTNADELQPGQHLLTHESVVVTLTSTTAFTETATVHNLTIANIHTYYVLAGETPVLVHNDGGLTPEQQRSLRSLQARSAEHQAKLDAYRANPDAFDNEGRLKNAPTPEIRQRIIDGRIKHLQKEIDGFNKQVDNLKRLGGMC